MPFVIQNSYILLAPTLFAATIYMILGKDRSCHILAYGAIILGLSYLVSGLFNIRTIFRLAEYAEGNDGHLQGHEAFFYILDLLSMLISAF